jgi:hypothetical protein
MKKLLFLTLTLLLPLGMQAQTEVMAWSNLSGIRLDGELIDFEMALMVGNRTTGKERQQSTYHRNGNTQQVELTIDGVAFVQKVTDTGRGKALIRIEAKAVEGNHQAAALLLDFNSSTYAAARIRVSRSTVDVRSANRHLTFRFSKNAGITQRGRRVLVRMLEASQQSATLEATLTADGTVDHSEAHVSMDVSRPGDRFMGLGGNFRLQNLQHDPAVIDYCLDNMRVAFGRVELPWARWQPREEMDPMNQSELDGHVEQSLQMARRLYAMGMPVILSTWFPPEWALDKVNDRFPARNGVAAKELDQSKMDRIYKSLADYITYAKTRYGIEFYAFSFNESDIGIDVIFTPEEHARFIREFGACLAKRGLKTKLLLGDNSDATTLDFIRPSLADAAARPYIAAVSFHSWRGCDDATLLAWAEAARSLNVPLIVGEGSTDAQAHRYPEIFNESTFALYEINLYMKLCSICQPLSILQWQLTSDYSLLWGGGIYRSAGELHPTQRFFNLKQLAATPAGAFALPVTSSKPTLNAAAFGNIAQGQYAVHMVNNGAACDALVSGLPADKTAAEVYVTNQQEHMSMHRAELSGGQLRVHLPSVSFITIIIK